MSTLDENGILIYDETDERGTFSALLNMGQEATSDALGASLARVAAVESILEPSGLVAPCTQASGFALTQNSALVYGRLMFFRVGWTRTGSAISATSDGNVPDTVIASFKPGFVPVPGTLFPAASVAPVASYFATDSGVWVGAVTPGSSIPQGATGQVAGMALLA